MKTKYVVNIITMYIKNYTYVFSIYMSKTIICFLTRWGSCIRNVSRIFFASLSSSFGRYFRITHTIRHIYDYNVLLPYEINSTLKTKVYNLKTMFSNSQKNHSSAVQTRNWECVKLNTIYMSIWIHNKVDSKISGWCWWD